MDAGSSELVKFLFNQGTGVAFGITCLIILYFSWKENIKDKNETIEKLKNIIYDRKTDRDNLLILMGEIKAHLAMSKMFKDIAQKAIDETLHQDENKRKRKLDVFVETTLLSEEKINK